MGLFAATILVSPTISPAQAAYLNSPISLVLTERLIRQPVGVDTWCGDCIGEDYTTGSPWTINPGWVEGYTPPITWPEAGSNIGEGCMWDVDDTFQYETNGNIMAPGVSLIATECRWPDNTIQINSAGGKAHFLRWWSPSPKLIIRYDFTWDAGSASYVAPEPTIFSSGVYEYRVCIEAPPGALGGTMIDPIPGSHDGDGVYEEIRVTITNPTTKKLNKTGGFFGTDIRDEGTWCNNEFVKL